MGEKKLVVYIHGKGGKASASEYFKNLFPDSEVVGFDYKSTKPWEAKEEFNKYMLQMSKEYNNIILLASSIGAFFSMSAGIDKYISKALFVSPVVNLEKLIMDMILWANTTEEELEKRKIIPVDFGEDLSWEYLQYVRNNPIEWNVTTEILYGEKDHLQSLDTINEFVTKTGAGLTVMKNGEHWFHTDEQNMFRDDWIRNVN